MRNWKQLITLGMLICSESATTQELILSGKRTVSETEVTLIKLKELLLKKRERLLSKSDSLVDQILLNSSGIEEIEARLIADAIVKVSGKYRVPGNVISSIAFVESSYKLDAVNKASNDYGIMQVNDWNVKALKLDKARLLTDLEYSLDAGVQILAWFVKRYPLREAIMRYNCGTKPSCVQSPSVKKYLSKVVRYW